MVLPEREATETTSSAVAAVTTEMLPHGGWVLSAEPGLSPECREVFHDGEFVGDARTIEVTHADGDPLAELAWASVPSEGSSRAVSGAP
jgi:hypothetical protein